MTTKRRNQPMSVAEMRARATATGECPHCDLMWQQFVASTADVDLLREERDEWRAAAHEAEGDVAALRQILAAQSDTIAALREQLGTAHEDGGRDR
jgi:hypothetical protein